MLDKCGFHFGAIEANSEVLRLQVEHLYQKILTQKWEPAARQLQLKRFQASAKECSCTDYLVRHEPSSKNVGFFRVVPASSDYQPLPCERYLEEMGYALLGQHTLYSRHLLAEISNFTLACDFIPENSAQDEKNTLLLTLYLTALSALYQECYKFACMLVSPQLLGFLKQQGLYVLQRSSETECEYDGTQILVMFDVRASIDALKQKQLMVFDHMNKTLEQRSKTPEFIRLPELGRFSLAS